MTFINPLAVALCLSAVAPFVLAGEGHGSGPHGAETSIGQPGSAGDVDRTVEVSLQDKYYEPDTIYLKAGETIRFVLKNEGALLHEFNIGTPRMHESHQAEMRKMMEQGMLTPTGVNHAMGSMSHDAPNSLLIEPGETKELIWTFSGATELQFACNIPGHYQSGMAGEFKQE